ncbi:avidin/streptavidin family protein [Bradyrhizobium sp. ma5]|uniref:avidin/streptavidin family protein n=1 Tax=Bradyrhizobium sp. ma5 TaxID=3344828 RepID=UPI0035D3EA7B
MNWKGKWRNQYGSIVEITDDARNRIEGLFTTALRDSGFFGQTVPVVGAHQGDCISFVCGGVTPTGDSVVSYTGLFREGKMETLWFVAADAAVKAEVGKPGETRKNNWWRAMTTGADTFERVL